jgi:type IV secretory pathway VirB3-like protein
VTGERIAQFIAYGIVVIIAGGVLAALVMLVLWLLSGLWYLLF